MKHPFIVMGLCCLSISSFGQNVVNVDGKNLLGGTTSMAKKVLDNATLKCYYAFSKKKTAAATPFRTDTMVLEIGNSVSRFYDPARLGRDSLVAAKMKNMGSEPLKSVSVFKGASAKDLTNMQGTIASSTIQGESYQIYKDKSKHKATVIDYAESGGDKYQFEDEIGTLPWKITDKTDTILSYACQQATVSFRGRDYTAWFAPDIPLSEGPWKFMGLPGLILKVEDTQQLFSFSLIGLQQLTATLPILIDDPKKTIKCTRAEFDKQKKKQSGGMQLNMNGGNVIIAEMPAQTDRVAIEIE